MTSTKSRALMGVSALILSAGLAAAAHAQTAVYGGGSTLSFKYVHAAQQCFGVNTPLYQPTSKGSFATPAPGVYNVAVAGVATNVDCSVMPHTLTYADNNAQLFVEGSGSGAGVQAFFQHNPTALGTYTDTDNTTGHVFPSLHYGTSDTTMGSDSVAVYNSGGTVEPATGKTVNVVAGGTTPGAGQFANPAATYGPMVQIPLLVTPITVAYSPVYKKVVQGDGTVKSYAFNITNAANKGVLRLDVDTYCKIFTGAITDWNDPAIAAVNGKAIKKAGVLQTGQGIAGYTPIYDTTDPDVDTAHPTNWHLPIELVGRTDSSGTTSIFTRALAAQCGAVVGMPHQFDDASNILPAWTGANSNGSTDVTATPGSGLYSTRNGSGKVAAYLQLVDPTGAAGTTVTTGKMGYLSPDFTGPVTTTYNTVAAQLQNYNNYATGAVTKTFVAPTAAHAAASYSLINPPTGADMADPSKWVQAPSKLADIAKPSSTTGYPIVGTTQILLYTCYADNAAANSVDNVGYKINEFVKFYLKNTVITGAASPALGTTGGVLAVNGFAPLPTAIRTALYNEFVVTTDATNHLWVSGKSDVKVTTTSSTGKPIVKTVLAHNPTCDSVTGG
jgi:ABC-type phosphate transport system substrate-binding protein